MPDPVVSPADTPDALDIANVENGLKGCDAVFPYDPDSAYWGLRRWADVLLAVEERDKAEIEDLRGQLRSAGRLRELAKAEAIRVGERDRRQIARLTEALAFYADADNYFETYPDETQVPMECPALADDGARARAVLASEEDARPMSIDPALAALCEATREDVNDLIAFSGGAFDCCPVCGKLANEHPPRAAGEGDK